MPLPLIVFVAFGMLLDVTHSEVNCRQRINIMDIRECCRFQPPNWVAYKDSCPQVTTQRHMNPCFFDCIFNVTESFDGEELHVGNVRTMLNNIFDGNQDFVDAFVIGFQKCEPIMKQQIAQFRNKTSIMPPLPPGIAVCSPVAAFYAICAHRNAFIYCPAKLWNSSPTCENAREYFTKCDRPGAGKRGSRNQIRLG